MKKRSKRGAGGVVGRAVPPLVFDLHPWSYTVCVCGGPLLKDGTPVAAVTHDRELLLCGTLRPHERIEALIDQLRRIREKHHGPIPPEGIASFTADVMLQLIAQGGPRTVERLKPVMPRRRPGKGARS